MAAFELMLRQSFGQVPERGEVSEVTIRAIVAGIRQVVNRRLRAGHPEELRDMSRICWNGRWPTSARTGRQAVAGSGSRLPLTASPPPPADAARLGGATRQRPQPGRAKPARADRAPRRAGGVEQGYDELSIPAISAAAGVSNQTFYENFASKGDALVAAFEALCQASHSRRRRGVCRAGGLGGGGRWLGSAGCLEFIAADPLFARLTYLELPTAGVQALESAPSRCRVLRLLPEARRPAGGLGANLPAVVIEAIGGGMWAVIEYEIVHGRVKTLPVMAPEIAAIALVPVGVLG